MLEFIVLGEVPGTHIVITFQWAVLLASLLIGTAVIKSIGKRQRGAQSPSVEEITL